MGRGFEEQGYPGAERHQSSYGHIHSNPRPLMLGGVRAIRIPPWSRGRAEGQDRMTPRGGSRGWSLPSLPPRDSCVFTGVMVFKIFIKRIWRPQPRTFPQPLVKSPNERRPTASRGECSVRPRESVARVVDGTWPENWFCFRPGTTTSRYCGKASLCDTEAVARTWISVCFASTFSQPRLLDHIITK